MILKGLILPIYCRIMANQLQLQRQIQEEIDREAEIDRKIESMVKKFLKRNKQFYRVPELNGCDAVLFYFRDDLTRYHIKVYIEGNEAFKMLHELRGLSFVYLKKKNTHNVKLHTNAFIRTSTPFKNFGK